MFGCVVVWVMICCFVLLVIFSVVFLGGVIMVILLVMGVRLCVVEGVNSCVFLFVLVKFVFFGVLCFIG